VERFIKELKCIKAVCAISREDQPSFPRPLGIARARQARGKIFSEEENMTTFSRKKRTLAKKVEP